MGSIWKYLYFTLLLIYGANAWSDSSSKKVKLTDVKTLTLYSGKYTTGKRSSPVPQLNCVGGSAGCSAFIPQVVQCYNRGSDGIDVQWECKADMDNAFRFGEITVSCEGYDYSDDPYILKGSCGLEYKLELTKEGMQQQKNYQYGSSYSQYKSYSPTKHGPGFSDVFFIGIVCLLMYAIYRSCLRRQQYSSTDDDNDHPDSGFRSGGSGYPSGGAPPPPGFRPSYNSDDNCHATRSSAGGTAPNFGGFWTGAAAGSALGYLFGNRNTNSGYYSSPSSGWGGGGFSGGFSGPSTSSGTRSASGFGGTSRR